MPEPDTSIQPYGRLRLKVIALKHLSDFLTVKVMKFTPLTTGQSGGRVWSVGDPLERQIKDRKKRAGFKSETDLD